MSRPRIGSASKEKDKEDKCKICDVKVSGKDKGILCEVCQGWWHCRCVKINEESYELLNMENIHWFCSVCNSGVGRILPTLTKLELKQNKLEEEMKVITADISDIKSKNEKTGSELETVKSHNSKLMDDVNKMKTEIDKQFVIMNKELECVTKRLTEQGDSDTQSNKWNDIVKRQVDESLESVTDNLQEVRRSLRETTEKAEEQRDKESRRNNIILYNVPENEEPRAEERNKADVAFCLQLFNNCLNTGVTEEDFVNVFRLGKRGDSTRPLMIQLAGYSHKNLIMESLYRLRHAETKFKKIIVAHDMTRTERAECKRLVAEAKEQADTDSSGEYIYRVRGMPGQMKIVRFRVRN